MWRLFEKKANSKKRKPYFGTNEEFRNEEFFTFSSGRGQSVPFKLLFAYNHTTKLVQKKHEKS